MKLPRLNRLASVVRGLLTGSSIAACLATVSHAGSLAWDASNPGNGAADGGSGTWDINATANWWDGVGNAVWPLAGGADDDAIFGNTAGIVTIATGGVTANDLTFNTDGYSVTGDTLTLSGTAPTVTTNTGTATIVSVIAGTSGLTKAGNGTLVLTGANTYTGTTTVSAGTLQVGNNSATGQIGTGTSALSIDTAGTVTLFRSGTGIAFDTPVSGTGTLEFKGSGTSNNGAYTIGGVNSGFSGTIKVSNARIQVNAANDLGSANVIVNSGGQVFASGGTYTNALSLNGVGWAEPSGNLGALRVSSGATWSGPVTLTGDTRISAFSSGDTGTISGAISGGFILQKSGAGTLTLSGANTYSGGTVLSAGTLALGNSAALGSGALSVVGSSTVTSTVPFATNISVDTGMTLTLNTGFNAHTGTISGAGAVTASANTELFGANTYTGGTTLTGSGSFVCINSDASLGAVPVAFSASNLTIASGGSNLSTFGAPANLNITLDANRGVLLTGSLCLDLKTGDTLTINGVISGAGGLNRNNSSVNGTLVLGGVNTYTGATRLNRGTTTISSIKNVGDATGSSFGNPTTVANGTISLSTGGTSATLKYVGTGDSTDRVIDLNGTTAGATLDQSGTGLLKFTSNLTATGLGSKALTLAGSTAGSGEVAGVIANNPTVGSTALSTAFASGATTVTLNSVDGIATGASITGTGIAAGTTITAINTSTRVVTLSAATTGASSGNYTVTGVENRTGLVKSGSGTWTLSGANTYTGVTTINGGVLSVAAIGNGGANGGIGAATNAAANLVLNGGKLLYTGATASTDRAFTLGTSGGSLEASGAGPLSLTSTAAITLSGTNTARTFTLSGANTGANTLAAVIGDNGTGATSFVKSGAGTWVLTGTNTYTGTTTVDGGTLQIGNGGTTGQIGAGAVTVNNGTLSINRNSNYSVAPAISGNASGVVSIDSPAAISISANGSMAGFSGTVNTNSGALILGVNNPGSAGAIWNVASGATLRGNSPGAVPGATRSIQLGALSGVAGAILRNGGSNPSSGTHLSIFEIGALNMNTTFAGSINDGTSTVTVGLTKVGAGTLTLSGSNAYTGATSITAGTLLVNGTVSGSAITVNGGTLGGSGTVKSIALTTGTLAPGNSPGVLNSGNVALNGGTFALDLTGAAPGAEYDQLNVAGSVAFNGLVALTIDLGSFNPLDDGSQSFTIVNNDLADPIGFDFGTNKAFSYAAVALDEGSDFFVGAQRFEITYQGGDGNDVVLTAVPEPSAAVSLIAGFGGLIAMHRRRRRS